MNSTVKNSIMYALTLLLFIVVYFAMVEQNNAENHLKIVLKQKDSIIAESNRRNQIYKDSIDLYRVRVDTINYKLIENETKLNTALKSIRSLRASFKDLPDTVTDSLLRDWLRSTQDGYRK